MTRTAWLAALGLGLVGLGAWVLLRWPSSAPALACDAADIRWLDAGEGTVAVCAPGTPVGPVPAGGGRLLGVKFDLNAATEAELAVIPGIGPSVAHALVQGRDARNGFRSWEEVDGVPGVGPARLEVLQRVSELRP